MMNEGWHRDGDGYRYWDGQQWAARTGPMSRDEVAALPRPKRVSAFRAILLPRLAARLRRR